jgi:hypothetical protein
MIPESRRIFFKSCTFEPLTPDRIPPPLSSANGASLLKIAYVEVAGEHAAGIPRNARNEGQRGFDRLCSMPALPHITLAGWYKHSLYFVGSVDAGYIQTVPEVFTLTGPGDSNGTR